MYRSVKRKVQMKNRIIIIIAMAVAAAALSSCAPAEGNGQSHTGVTASTGSASSEEETAVPAESAPQEDGYSKITAEEAKNMMDSQTVIILDVRTQEEFDSGYIKDAVRLEMADFESQAATVLPDKDAVILVYCRTGNRSATASRMLIAMGYTKVFDFGGIYEWPYDVVK